MKNIHEKPIIFRSQDNSVDIEFTKEKINRNFSFAKTDEEDRYMYTMIIKNAIGTIIKVINLSDCEMYILLDNLYFFLQSKNETMTFSLSCKDSIGTSFIFTLESLYFQDDTNITHLFHSIIGQSIFKIHQFLNDTIVPIISFDISNSIPEFINCIYEICIQGLDISNDEYYTATNIGKLIKPDFLL